MIDSKSTNKQQTTRLTDIILEMQHSSLTTLISTYSAKSTVYNELSSRHGDILNITCNFKCFMWYLMLFTEMQDASSRIKLDDHARNNLLQYVVNNEIESFGFPAMFDGITPWSIPWQFQFSEICWREITKEHIIHLDNCERFWGKRNQSSNHRNSRKEGATTRRSHYCVGCSISDVCDHAWRCRMIWSIASLIYESLLWV
jgi:hypothetical protein